MILSCFRWVADRQLFALVVPLPIGLAHKISGFMSIFIASAF
jgi:hypothetical protein